MPDILINSTRKLNAYSTWQNLVNESIVRAAVIIYLIDNRVAPNKIRQSVNDEMFVGFYWTPELVKCLQYYTLFRRICNPPIYYYKDLQSD